MFWKTTRYKVLCVCVEHLCPQKEENTWFFIFIFLREILDFIRCIFYYRGLFCCTINKSCTINNKFYRSEEKQTYNTTLLKISPVQM